MTTSITEWNYNGTKGYVKSRTLVSDIKRGVKFLNESAYSNYWGSTKSSAIFFQAVAKVIDMAKTYRVDFIKSSKHWFTIRIHTKDGYVVQFKGFSYGYYGEGSRGTVAALLACGFSVHQIHKIFTRSDEECFKMYRKVSV